MERRETLHSGANCRICQGEQFIFVQEIPYLRSPGLCRFIACVSCGTVFDAGSFEPDYRGDSNTRYEWPDIKFYVEYGAELESLAVLLAALNSAHSDASCHSRSRFLDVGTAFGFAVAMAHIFQWDATGVEPSDFGVFGSQLLSVHIIHNYLKNARLAEHSFDYILASDVIEHVTDPSEFIAAAARYLAPDGILLLTTPNSEILVDNVEPELVDILSPGYHMNILSPRALQRILRENGFNQIEMVLEGGLSGRRAITVFAARRPGTIAAHVNWGNLQAQAVDVVEQYLVSLVEQKELQDNIDILYGGALFRLFMRRMATSDYIGAEQYEKKIERVLAASGWGLDQMAQLEANDFFSYVSQVPAYAGMFYFQKGMLDFYHRRNFRTAVRDFDVADHLFDIERKTLIYPRVSWPERAQYHRAVAQLHSWHPCKALKDFDRLVRTPSDVPAEYWNSIYRHKALAHLGLGQIRLALEWLRKARSSG
jgi:SAM-dependent methyltransferase